MFRSCGVVCKTCGLLKRCQRNPVNVQVGRSVQKKRASKAKAVEQLAKETIKFSESIESLSVKRVAECDKKPEKTGSKKAVQQHETDDTIVLAKSQGKRNSEGISDAVGKKVPFLHLPADACLSLRLWPLTHTYHASPGPSPTYVEGIDI